MRKSHLDVSQVFLEQFRSGSKTLVIGTQIRQTRNKSPNIRNFTDKNDILHSRTVVLMNAQRERNVLYADQMIRGMVEKQVEKIHQDIADLYIFWLVDLTYKLKICLSGAKQKSWVWKNRKKKQKNSQWNLYYPRWPVVSNWFYWSSHNMQKPPRWLTRLTLVEHLPKGTQCGSLPVPVTISTDNCNQVWFVLVYVSTSEEFPNL